VRTDFARTKDGPTVRKQDGWTVLAMIDRGRAFDFLSSYLQFLDMKPGTSAP